MFFLSLLCFVLFQSASSELGSIGVNYGRIADNLPDPSRVVELLKSNGIFHESGWPSAGGDNEFGAGPENAALFIQRESSAQST